MARDFMGTPMKLWNTYLLAAVRSTSKDKWFSVIKIGGIAIGVAACLFILSFVRHEQSYDSWLADSERLFRLEGTLQFPGQEPIHVADSPGAALPALVSDLPQIEAGTRLLSARRAVRRGGEWLDQDVVFADPNLLSVLKLPLVSGSPSEALDRPDAALVTEDASERLFGAGNPVGRTFEVGIGGTPRIYRVAAVLREIPANSNLELGLVLPLQVGDFDDRPGLFDDWSTFGLTTFVKLRSPGDAEFVRSRLQPILARHGDTGAPGPRMSDMFRLRLVNIEAIHLQTPAAVGGFKPAVDPVLIGVLAVVALLIFLIATLNYVNLSIAGLARRAREVGVRKTFGASRRQIAAQFLTESMLIAGIAGLLGYGLFELLLPWFNDLFGLELRVRDLGGAPILAAAAMVLVAGLGGGAYPALIVARMRPRQVLGGGRVSGAQGSETIRTMLVTVQFTVATALIICVAVMFAQIGHLRSLDLGYRPDGLMVITGIDRRGVASRQEGLRRAIEALPGVVGVTRSAYTPANEGQTSQNLVVPGVPPDQSPTINAEPVDFDFASVYGARLRAGRFLREGVAMDDATGLGPQDLAGRGHNILINTAAVRTLGYQSPERAVGRQIRLGGDQSDYPVTIVGVVDDLRMRSARAAVAPAYYFRDDARLAAMTVRFEGLDPAIVRERARAVWAHYAGAEPFDATFVEEAVAEQYGAETRQGRVLAVFSVIAVLLSCLGLHGLAVFAAERRTKEIGIRKVLGARNGDIVRLLAWQACRPVLLANLIAWPLAAWLMLKWLSGFSERIPLNPLWFLAAGALALAVAFATVASHALRVARQSPIQALRYE